MVFSLLDPRFSKLAMTPFGRTSPIDKTARRLLFGQNADNAGVGFLHACAHFFVLAVLLLGAVVAGLGGRFDIDALYLVVLVPLGLPPWALACWQIRRLHDTGRSGLHLAKPIFVHLGRWLAFIIGTTAFMLAATSLASRVLGAELERFSIALVAFTLVAGFGIWAAYSRWILKPHRERWQANVEQAPGDPLENRFGPPPK